MKMRSIPQPIGYYYIDKISVYPLYIVDSDENTVQYVVGHT